MYKLWQKKTNEEIKTRVFEALRGNVNYNKQHSLGIPASYLDKKVFSQDDSFLKNAPFMAALVQNPNNIGCHTTGTSLSYFRGTQELEKELIEICAVDIFGGAPQQRWICRRRRNRSQYAGNMDLSKLFHVGFGCESG